ncbi:MAG TPA: hypothetical protein GX003_04760 [Acholeplasmataceae bacterium]|nr:hypothetical protein [Acholeplasmataceae bacterium]
MVQAVSAANMSQGAATLNSNASQVTLANSTGPQINQQAIEVNLADSLVGVIDQQLLMLETFLQNVEIKHSDSNREGYEKMATYDSKDLLGADVNYVMHYNVTEHEVETEFKGLLVITVGKTVKELLIDGQVEIDPVDGEKELTVIHEANDIKVEVSSKLQKGEREFQYIVDPKVGQKLEFKLKIKNEKGKLVLELETKIGDAEVEMKLHMTNDEAAKKEILVELELEEFDVVIGTLESELEVLVTIENTTHTITTTYKFKGSFKFTAKVGGAVMESELDFSHVRFREKNIVNPEIAQIENIISSVYDTHKASFIRVENGVVLFDYNAIAAITLLNENGYDYDLTQVVPKQTVVEYLNTATISSEGDAFKLMLLAKAYGLEVPSSIITYTENLASVASFYSYPMALALITNFNNNQALLNTILADLPTVHTNEWFDSDTAAFILATSTNREYDKTNLYNVITTNKTKDGILGWDGKASSSSTAMALIAYTSNGKTLNLDESTTLTQGLIKFYDATAKGFKTNLDSTEIDIPFATPQAFAALALYLVHLRVNKTVNLYY